MDLNNVTITYLQYAEIRNQAVRMSCNQLHSSLILGTCKSSVYADRRGCLVF
jgi:hypothetical protein